ncbi:hypothetical protein IE53DRAFT_409017 [Violaceomyces palustris]|uniref:Uncharacterized protein n=1 Tax=Violaceomyces palustris TaxID=1673888 RepID=A0ACD0P4F2_9BASI|nr:hypothetical protein IE53DRAFT_409017 [Violaceomyces palustris]
MERRSLWKAFQIKMTSDPHDLFLSNGIKVGDSRTKFGTLKGMRKGKERDSVTKGKQDREVEANHWATVGKEKATRNTLDTTPSATLQGPNPQRANSRERDVDEFVDTPGLQGLKPNNRGRDGESSLELAVEGRSRSNSSLTNPMWEKMGLASMKYPPSSSSALKLGQRVPRRSGSAGAIARSDQSLNSDYESNEDSHHSRPVSRLEKVLNVLNRNGSEQSHVPANDGWGSSTTHQAAEVEVSNDLATRLNELAVANGDGLLSDEEYRLLRKGVFDEMMQRDGGAAMEIPKEPTFGWRTPNTNQRSTLSIWEREAIVSIRLLPPLQRRWSLPPAAFIDELILYGPQLFQPRSPALSLSITYKGWPSWGFQGRLDLFEEQNYGRIESLGCGNGEELFFSSLGSFNVKGQQRHGIGQIGPLFGIVLYVALSPERGLIARQSSAELRAEIAVLEAEGRSLLETFDGLEQVVIGKHSGLDHLILRRVVTETKSKFNQTGGGLSVSIVNSSSTAPPSSYKAPRKMSISSERYSATSAEGCLTEISAHGSDPEIEAEVESFRQELEEVALKKETVVKRYDERIGLLKSKLRSATIRESLIK